MPIARAMRAFVARLPRGQSLVEFALVLPVLLLLLGGAVDLGRLFYAQVAISNAAKEGAFFGASNPTCDQPKAGCVDPGTVSWHIDQETAGLTPLSYTVECLHLGASVGMSSCAEDDIYRVSLSYAFHLATPLLSGIFGSSVQLHATASAVVLNEAFVSGATPLPTSSTTPSPSPTPIPGNCIVPDLVGTRANNAAGTWSASGFTGSVTKSGNGNFTIQSQSLSPGSSQPCSSAITVSSSAPTPSPVPTPTPTPVGTPTPTPTPTPYATPTPTPSCLVVPNLVGMKVSAARTAWAAAGFTGGFNPSSGHGSKTVTNQVTNPSSAPGQCISPNASVTVTYG
jgi:TadE-like protein